MAICEAAPKGWASFLLIVTSQGGLKSMNYWRFESSPIVCQVNALTKYSSVVIL